MHDFILSGIVVSPRPLPVAPAQHDENMTEQRATVRVETSRVVRAVVRFVNSEYEPGSATGRLSIHESRTSRRHETGDDVDIETIVATCEDVLMDAIVRAVRRRELIKAAYAPPSRRMDVLHLEGEDKGKPLPCVAPRALVARIVHGKPTRQSNGEIRGVRQWRLEMVTIMGKLPRESQTALVKAVEIAGERLGLSNHLAAARSDVERLRGSSKRKAAALREIAARRLHDLEARDRESSQALDALVRGDWHRYGLRRLEEIISGSPEIENAIFPEEF